MASVQSNHATAGATVTQHVGNIMSASRSPATAIPVAKAKLLEGKRGLIVGIANDQSIAWGCAKAFRAFGAELAVTFLNDKAKKYVEPLATALEAPIAFSPREALQGRIVDVGREGFLTTMDVSCWSFIRMAHLAEPLMRDGGTLFTMSYYSSQMVVKNYNIVGVAKAALESAVRYLAAELGPKGIRVHAISPGPLATRAASGIPEFDALLDQAKAKAPSRSLVSIDDVGVATAFLAHDAARLLTGDTLTSTADTTSSNRTFDRVSPHRRAAGHEDDEQGSKHGRCVVVPLIQGAPARCNAISQHSHDGAGASRP